MLLNFITFKKASYQSYHSIFRILLWWARKCFHVISPKMEREKKGCWIKWDGTYSIIF